MEDDSMEGFLNWEVSSSNRITQPNGSIDEQNTPLPFHKCNDIDKEKYLFKFKPNQKDVEEGLWPNLFCLDDPSKVNLNGHATTI